MKNGVYSGRTVGNYKIYELIGEGGQGAVYRCLHTSLQQERAVKFLRLATDEDSLNRFRDREIRAQSLLRHDNIVQALDWIEEPEKGLYGIVMEYIAGENLKSCIRREGAFSLQKTLDIAIQIGSSLAYAHQKGVIHRDVKSANILLKDRSTAKLTDFGIARLTSDDKRTKTGIMMGTIEYMSPEQIRGEKNIRESTDIYSLGIVIYEMLTGRLPFTGEGEFEIQQKQLYSRPLSPRRISREMKNYIPASLEQNLLKALAKKPGKRHISMNSFVEELEMCFSPEIKNYYHRGVLAFEREYFSSAKNYFSRVISIDPKYEEVNDYYKRTLESSKSLEEKPKQETQKKEKEREVFSFTGKVIGEYKIGNRIGKGSQGVVYLSSHIPTSKELAIKFLRGSPGDEDILKRFKDREARALFSLNHNNIVRAVDWIEEPEMGIYGIAMEYIEGLNLKKYISQKGPLSESKTLDIAIKLADGISYAHQKNVIHRDIKSTNILVGNKGDIKLADFGIAQLVSSEKLTRSRQIMGTIEYMSPEQIRGDTNIGVQSDIYSLGIIIYEMLTGNVPFTGNTQHEIQEKQLRQKPVSLKKIIKTIPMKSLENLDKVILSALMKKAYQRPATMELFKQELQNCLKSLTEEKTTIQDNIGRAEQLISQEDYRGAQTILKETLVLQPYNKRATELYERTKIFLRKEKEKAFKIIFMTTIFFLLVAGIFASNNYNYEKKVFKKFDILVNGKDYASAIKYYEDYIEKKPFRFQNEKDRISKTVEGLKKDRKSTIQDVLEKIKDKKWPDEEDVENLKSFYPEHEVVKCNNSVKNINSIFTSYQFPPEENKSFAESQIILDNLKKEVGDEEGELKEYISYLDRIIKLNVDVETRAQRVFPKKLTGNPPKGLHEKLSACYNIIVDLSREIRKLQQIKSDPNSNIPEFQDMHRGAIFLLETYKNRIDKKQEDIIKGLKERAKEIIETYGVLSDKRPLNIF